MILWSSKNRLPGSLVLSSLFFIMVLLGFHLYSIFAPDDRNLFDLFSYGLPFQSKDHIAGALKKSNVFLPARPAFAML